MCSPMHSSQKATDFFKKRAQKKYGIDGKHANQQEKIHPV
ncbi:MAG: hypothetical protein ACFWUC_09160 [Oscillospiraceae bacterium]